MNKPTTPKDGFGKKWHQWLLAIPIFILVFFGLIITVIQIPAVQTRILNTITKSLASQTDFRIEIGYANLTWYDKFILEDIAVYDELDSALIATDKLQANISLYTLIMERKIKLEELELDKPDIRLIKTSDSTGLNITRLIGQLRKNKTSKSSSKLTIGSITVNDGAFTYSNLTKPAITEGKDYNHFRYKNINTRADQFTQSNDTITFELVYMQGVDLTDQLNIHALSGFFSYCNQSMSLAHMNLKTDHSQVKDSIRLQYPSSQALGYFTDSVSFYINLDSSFISSRDIALFAPSVANIDELYEIDGQIKGKVGNLMASNIQLRFGKNTSIDGNLNFFGLPKIKETFIDLSCKNATLEPADLTKYFPESIHQQLLNAGTIAFRGEFQGFPTDFVANGAFDTKAGFVESDINLKLGSKKQTFFSGNLSLQHFDLGKILDKEDIYQEIYFNGQVNGKLQEFKNPELSMTANIDSIGIRGYTYANIYADGQLANDYFEGKLKTKDPNLVFDGQLNIDFRENKEKINITACLDALKLKPLGFAEKDIFISSHINADLEGFHIDSLKGFANLENTKLLIESDLLQFDSIKFISQKNNNERIIALETDGLSAQAKGDFKNSNVVKEINDLYKELRLNLINDEEQITTYYEQKEVEEAESFEVELKINFWDANRFIQPFRPDIKVSKNLIFDGHLTSDNTSIVTLNSVLDTLAIGDNLLLKNQLDIFISKKHNQRNTLASFFISSNEQQWNENSRTDNIYFETIWSNDHMDLEFNLAQENLDNNLDLKAGVDFLQDSILFYFKKSDIQALGKYWSFDSANQVIFHNDKFIFDNVSLRQDDQSIAVNGILSNVPSEQLHVDIRNFSVKSLNTISPIEISGIVDGNIDINMLEDDILIGSNIKAQSFYIEDFLVGDIDCFSDWENNRDRLGLNFTVNRSDKRIIDVMGYFYPMRDGNQLDMQADFDNANLNIIQPFIKDYFTNLSGLASGSFYISGTPTAPILDSKNKPGTITDGHITINYTNTTYTFSGGIVFEENQIGVDNLKLVDSRNNEATFNGGIFHDGFQHFILDIAGQYNNFKLLGTGPKDNSLYYGTAFATGNINILGAVNNLQIKAYAKTNKGTRISIPIGELSEYNVEQKDYISFVDLSDPEHQKRIAQIAEEEINLKGLKLDFEIEVTNDAYTELIFDVKSGDIIRGRGNGNIKLLIDPYGDFNMFGDLQIESGGYNFTLYNIINKEFDIQKGSSISWYGDPYGAQLNIHARYRQLASLAPILNVTSNDSKVRTKYPSIVDLYLNGNLMSPEISFDIDIQDYPDNIFSEGNLIPVEDKVRAFKSRLDANEQEMKRQVFSLVILRKFSPENSFQVNTSQTFGNSLSEFVSNQLSYWATQVDENLEVDVNLAGLSDEALNTFQLRLSYSFLDGRLKVTRGGGFADEQNHSDISSIIGDWTVEYLLTPDGRFRAKMYSRSNANSYTSRELGNNNNETGFSFQYIRSFDQLKDLLIETRKKNLPPTDEEPSTKSEAIREEEEPEPSSK